MTAVFRALIKDAALLCGACRRRNAARRRAAQRRMQYLLSVYIREAVCM